MKIPLSKPGAVKKFKTGRDREGEAPAEPRGARICWGDSWPGGSPSQFSHGSAYEIMKGARRPLTVTFPGAF
ncbi:MAG: hypothetical protein DMG05_26210 [Acidobacteria bacterium]|nr:MAG: hypothetical protein DMG05_26210 [Acidobacteriota bacterium]